jgi:hypothetical protein
MGIYPPGSFSFLSLAILLNPDQMMWCSGFLPLAALLELKAVTSLQLLMQP